MNNLRNFNFTDNNYLILRTIKTYTRTKSGKSWRIKADEVECKVASPQHYTNYVTATPFFNNFGYGAYCRAYYNYTVAGYLPTTITTVSPHKEVKKIATFEFIKISELKKNGGWRELFIVDNAKYFEIITTETSNHLKLITLFSDATHSAVVDLKTFVWVN